MFVTKRDGITEEVKFDRITERINRLVNDDEKKYIDPILIGQKVVAYLHTGITTEILDIESANICINLCTKHPLYSNLGGRILVSNLHKKTTEIFSHKIRNIQKEINFFDDNYYKFVYKNAEMLDNLIDYKRDYIFDYFGFKTLERAYLIKNVKTGQMYERPQDMFMRVSSFLNQDNMEELKETYDLTSQGYYTHASPTLFNSASKRSQLSSCFLIGTDDSIEGITNTWKCVSQISKYGGGIGLHVSNIRSKGSIIKGTNGPSSGIIPMLQVYNSIARYINQCFTGDVKVYTKDGLKPIKNIKPGDKVFTENGRLCEVKKVYQDHYKNEALDMKIMHNFDHSVIVTPEHPFRVVKNQKKMTNYNVIENRFKKNLVELEWIDAKNITEDDLIMIPIPSYEKDITEYTINDCYMYGIMLGDGHICSNTNEAGVTLGHKKEELFKFVKEYLELNMINYWITKTETTNQIRWSISSKFKFTRSQLYDDNKIKCFDTNMINLPLEKSKYIFKGLTDTDGCIQKELTIELTSKQVLESIKYILLRMGVLTSGYSRDRVGNVSSYKDITTRLPTWVLRIPKVPEVSELLNIEPAKFKKYFRYENMLFTRLESVEKKMIDTIVYDLEIDTNHNYLTEIGLVHNGGKRKGSIAIYLEPHHADIFEFLDLRKNFGDENKRARDLFLAVWISDLFMKQVKDDADWYLMCPDECKGLSDCWGKDYESLYWKYVSEGKYREKIKARKLMKAIWVSQQETGTPYITYKDTVNRKSNQKNLGTIKSSNLCNEIVEYSDANEHAVCNLASIALNKMVVPFEYKGKKWIIYTKENCKYCKWTKSWLEDCEVEEVNIEDSSFSYEKLLAIQKLADNMELLGKINNDSPFTYPQIFCKTDDQLKYIGGFEDLYNFTKSTYDYEKLRQVAYVATRNLNKVIDLNYYPTIETKRSNLKNRPIGLGIQGLADTLAQLRIEYESEECIEFNKHFMETIYLGAMECSADISKQRQDTMKDLIHYINMELNINNIPEHYDSSFEFLEKDILECEIRTSINYMYHKLKPQRLELQKNSDKTTLGSYSTFEGSPFSKGIFQFNMWGIETSETKYPNEWIKLKEKVIKYGTRNSLLTALMPTASTSQILGNNECFELFTSNIYTRNTIAGDFPIVNKHLVHDLVRIKEWNNDIKDFIIGDNGSIRNLGMLPDSIKNLYKTQWEVKQIWVLKTAKARGPFVDQTQSMNVFLEKPDDQKLNSCLFWGWENGLKSGIYYLRSKPATNATKFTVDPNIVKKIQEEECENCSA